MRKKQDKTVQATPRRRKLTGIFAATAGLALLAAGILRSDAPTPAQPQAQNAPDPGATALEQAITPAALATHAGMKVVFFKAGEIEQAGIGASDRVLSGPNLQAREAGENPAEYIAAVSGLLYPRLSWVVAKPDGAKTCYINVEEDETPVYDALDRLTAAFACAMPEGQMPHNANTNHPIWPRAFISALNLLRDDLKISDAAIETYFLSPERPYLETYYLSIVGKDEDRHCPAVYEALDQRSDAIVKRLSTILINAQTIPERQQKLEEFYTSIKEKRDYDALYLYMSAQATASYTDGDMQVGEIPGVMRGNITAQVPLPRCSI